jgi:fused signal recognition particle receptor
MFKLLRKKLAGVVGSISRRMRRKRERPNIKRKVELVERKVRKGGRVRKVVRRVVRKLVERELSEADLDPILEELKLGLMEADVAYEVAERIGKELKQELLGKRIRRGLERKVVVRALRKTLRGVLSVPSIDLGLLIKQASEAGRPAVLVFLGFNGTGKSLSLAKVGKWLTKRGHRPILAAGDTFRAAGIQQLKAYARDVGLPVVSQTRGSDSCAVIYDCIEAARARGHDVVLADTAGRAHTDRNLMEELQKICRVNRPDLKVLVLDSLAGSDVLNQYEFFDNAVGVDAIVFSKLDINEKGGNVLSVCHLAKKPIIFLGTGQGYDELEAYDPDKLLDRLLPT